LLKRPQPKPKKIHRLLFFWFHPDQAKISAEYIHYRNIINEDRRLLGLSHRDLAKDAKISLLAIWAFSIFPDFIPRPDYLERLCEALLLPVEYLKQGGSYGFKYSTARLYRYDYLGYGRLFHWARIREASQEELDEMVANVQALRREELRGKEGRAS
jgi:hypothetical protein